MNDAYATGQDRVLQTTSVVIVTFNSCPVVNGAVAGVLDAGIGPARIHVVDNFSNAIQRAQVSSLLRAEDLVLLSENVGFARAANVGIARCLKEHAEFILLINPDVEIRQGALEELARQLLAHPRAVAAGPNQKAFSSMIRRSEPRVPIYSLPERQAVPVKTLCGFCLLVRASFLSQYGGFDEDFYLYREDTAFSRKVRLTGFELVEAKQSIVFHETATGSTTNRSFRLFHSTRGLFILARKASSRKMGRVAWGMWALARTTTDLLAYTVNGYLSRATFRSCVQGMYDGLAGPIRSSTIS